MRRSFSPQALEDVLELIQRGSFAEAYRRWQALAATRVPREYLWRVGFLARRMERPLEAIRVLRRQVYSRRGRLAAGASDREIAEYAMAVGQLGALAEAHALLDEVSPARAPNALVFRAMLYFSEYRFRDAVAPLERLRETDANELTKLSGEVRLMEAFVWAPDALSEELEKARVLADRLCGDPRISERFGWIGRQARLTSIWLARRMRQYSRARAELGRLAPAAQAGGDERLAAERALLKLLVEVESGKQRADARAFGAIAARLAGLRYWDMVRLADLLWAETTRDRDRFAKLLHGSPQPAFRAEVRRAAARAGVEIPETFELALGPEPGRRVAGRIELCGLNLLPGGALELALNALCSDFYRPFQLPELHGLLHSDESYDPASSSERMHRVLRRLRLEFERCRLPLRIEHEDGFYRLGSLKPVRLVLESSPTPATSRPLRAFLEQARASFGNGPFSARELARLLGLSERSVQGYARQALEAGLLRKQGAGPSTRYALPA